MVRFGGGSALRAGVGSVGRREQGKALRAVWADFARTGVLSGPGVDAARLSFG